MIWTNESAPLCNRNWDVTGFGLGVTSSKPCRETYKGTQPNSEPETRAVAETIEKYKDNIRIYLTFHRYCSTSFSQSSQMT